MRRRTAVPRTTGKSYHNNIITQRGYLYCDNCGVIGDRKKKYESVSCFEDYNFYISVVRPKLKFDTCRRSCMGKDSEFCKSTSPSNFENLWRPNPLSFWDFYGFVFYFKS
jgi:hypothetical protein